MAQPERSAPHLMTIRNEALSVAISTRGAELQSIRTADGEEWLWQGDERFWTGRAPVLFPVIGRSPGGHVLIDGAPFPMESHGFARGSEFAVSEQSPTSCAMTLTASATTRACFPFDFSMRISFALCAATLVVRADVTNEGAVAMPFCIGFHPAFRWRMPGAGEAEHRIVLDGAGDLAHRRLDADGLVTGTNEPSLFRSGTLVLDPGHFGAGALILESGADDLAVSYAAGRQEIRLMCHDVTHLGIWSILGAEFVCIEPFWGSPAVAGGSNELGRRAGAQQLRPHESRSFAMAIDLPSLNALGMGGCFSTR